MVTNVAMSSSSPKEEDCVVAVKFLGPQELVLTPEISTNIRVLKLAGTAIEELPPSIMSWPHLRELVIKGCTKLVSLPHYFPTSLRFKACLLLLLFPCNVFLERCHVSHRIMRSPQTWQEAQVSKVAFQKDSLHDHC
ncbi:hypothetical protein F2Q68_00019756 [Brassica cretica]|uniref:Disease resistance protein n=1 Tax=Brassica cretica TaxID=69181 RepID=A0A8S9G3Q5_BRACR|nr:hypothetical protein F2Q68_00019756 [Brassica cretica]